jgi:diguanylate cyclase (GGDEF)-like protein
MDLGLPDTVEFSGLETLTKLALSCPTIVLTGLQGFSRGIDAIERGASDYIVKSELSAYNLYRSIRYAIERKKAENDLGRLTHMTRTDPLTQVWNRRVFEEYVDRACESAMRSGTLAMVMICDMNDFKEVNDNYGHQVGDELLRRVARRLAQSLRKVDIVARIGGDEFGVVLLDLPSVEGGMKVAEKIHSAVSEQTFRIGGLEIFADIAVGYAMVEGEGKISAADIITHADSAMFKAKNAPGCSVAMYDEHLQSESRQKYQLKKSMAEEVNTSNFMVYYQPIVKAGTHEIVAAEALARWYNGSGKFVPPDLFIPIAEETNLINGITLFNIQRICGDIKRWRSLGLSVPPISVNFSPFQFRGQGIVDQCVRSIVQVGLEPSCFQVEIVETAAIKDMAVARRIIEAFQAHGIRVHLDDFGTGYSSLSMLRELPIDTIKIDKSFLIGSEGGQNNLKILEGMLRLASSIGTTTIVEGVETMQAARQMGEMGADFLQGYCFSEPVSAPDFAGQLARRGLGRVAVTAG